jgi:adenine phosphoribosyltransferase
MYAQFKKNLRAMKQQKKKGGGRGFFLALVMLSMDGLGACPETYTVKCGGWEKKYDVRSPSPESAFGIVYINFREDQEVIDVMVGALQNRLPQGLDLCVIVGDKANIFGALLARAKGLPWIVLTSKKPLTSFEKITYRSITSGEKTLFLSQDQAKKIRNKRLVILDDVLSTGETMAAAVKLVKGAGGQIEGLVVGFTEGEDRKNLSVEESPYPLIKGGHLPLFKRS